MRGKIGPSGINDEAPKGRGKRWPSAAFWSQKQTHRKRNKCPTGNPFHPILIYYPFSFSNSNIGKKKPHLQESKFLFQNIHILSPSHPHIGTARNLHRLSHHFQIFNSQIFSSLRLLSHTILSFLRFQTSSAFKLFFFSANAGNKKESEGILSLVRH